MLPSSLDRRRFLTSTAAVAVMIGASRVSRAQGDAAMQPSSPTTTPASTPRSPHGTRLILLGTKGGPRLTPQFHRGQPAQVILANGVPYVVDCGSGVGDKLVLAGVNLAQLRHIFITHHHSDHVLDYGNLFLLAWAAGLKTRIDTWGPPPIERMTRLAFEMNAYDIDLRIEEEGRPDPRKLVVAHEFSEPGLVMQDENVKVTAALVQHGPVRPAFAYRFDGADGRSIVISGDTTPSDSLVALAKGADVLVHEVMYLPALDRLLAKNPNAATLREHLIAGHTSTNDVGRIAAAAGVGMLVLSHLVPGDDPSVTDEMWTEGPRKHYAGPIVVARDLMEI